MLPSRLSVQQWLQCLQSREGLVATRLLLRLSNMDPVMPQPSPHAPTSTSTKTRHLQTCNSQGDCFSTLHQSIRPSPAAENHRQRLNLQSQSPTHRVTHVGLARHHACLMHSAPRPAAAHTRSARIRLTWLVASAPKATAAALSTTACRSHSYTHATPDYAHAEQQTDPPLQL
jgi:hypothetical protein